MVTTTPALAAPSPCRRDSGIAPRSLFPRSQSVLSMPVTASTCRISSTVKRSSLNVYDLATASRRDSPLWLPIRGPFANPPVRADQAASQPRLSQ